MHFVLHSSTVPVGEGESEESGRKGESAESERVERADRGEGEGEGERGERRVKTDENGAMDCTYPILEKIRFCYSVALMANVSYVRVRSCSDSDELVH
jgi:hypothetical protein